MSGMKKLTKTYGNEDRGRRGSSENDLHEQSNCRDNHCRYYEVLASADFDQELVDTLESLTFSLPFLGVQSEK